MNRIVVALTVGALLRAAHAQPAGGPAPDAPSPAPEESPATAEDAPAAPAAPPASTTKHTHGGPSDPDLADIEAALAADTVAQHPPTAPGGGLLATMNPDLAVVLGVGLAAFSSEDTLQTGEHDPAATGFYLQQLELSISKAVDPYFRFDGNLVFSGEGVEIEEAYATTLALPASLQVRAGQFLTRFGRINGTHPHRWDFVDQPFAIGRVFGGEGSRGRGVELSYLTPAPFFLELVGSVTSADGEGTARSFFGASDATVESPLDFVTMLAAKSFFELSPNWSWAVGASLASGPNATGDGHRTEVWGVDTYLKYRPITRASDTVVAITSEWLYRRRQVPTRLQTDTSGYASVFWKFARRWGTAARYELGTSGRDELDPDWRDARHRASTVILFYPTEFSRLRLQGSVDVPTWTDSPIWAGMLALEVVVGAHGAHAF